MTVVPQLTSSSALLSQPGHDDIRHVDTDSVPLDTLVGVVAGALVILIILIIIILVLVVRRQNYLKKCARSEDYILHSEEQLLGPPSIPAPPPMPPTPLHNPQDYKLTPLGGQAMSSLQIGTPAWLNEIQSNALFSKQKHKLDDDEETPLRSISGEECDHETGH